MELVKKRISMDKKRGQITIFIIVGIILLIAIALGAYLLVRSAAPETGTGPANIANVPVELQPVSRFVTDCLKSTAEDAIRIVMEHGGYADFSKLHYNRFQPTEADSVEYSPDSGYLVPYWSYMKSSSKCSGGCEFASMMKPLCRQGHQCATSGSNSFEEEIDWYIVQNLGKCLNNFTVFSQQSMDVKVVGEIEPLTTIRNDSVNVYLKLPLKISYQGTTKEINEFAADIPSGISELYKAAFDITQYEMNNCLLEKHELNVMAFYQGLDSGDLPPYYAETTGDQARHFWIMQSVQKKLKSVTSLAMQQIRIFNTSVFPYSNVTGGAFPKTVQAMYDQFVFFPLKGFHSISASFFYFPWWEPYLQISPSKGSLIPPSYELDAGGSGWIQYILNLAASRRYEYYYQYSFPVVAELRRWDAKNLREELFRFALEPNIRANKCFIANATLSVNDVSGETLLCDESSRGDQKHTIKVSDELTGAPAMGAEILFYAGESCSLGKTDSSGKLITTFPAATGGFIEIQKQGYLDYYVQEQDFGMLGDIKMKPLIDKGVSIKIFNETDMLKMVSMNQQAMINFRNSVSYSPGKNLSLILSLAREKDSYHDGPLEQTITLMPDDNGNLKMVPESVQLAPGKYTAEIMLVYNAPVVVVKEYDRVCSGCDKLPAPQCKASPLWLPECDESNCDYKDDSACTKKCWQQTDCYKWGFTCGSGCDADQEITYDELKLDSVPDGGVVFDVNNNYWVVPDYATLNNPLAPDVRFYVVQQQLPVRHYMLESLDAYRNYSKNYKYLFIPEFTNG